jgi:hypothetical protein
MTTLAAQPSTNLHTTEVPQKGHIGLIVLGAIASGLLLGLLLVLVVFAGGPEHEIIGAALFALGSGFVLLALGSSRVTTQPQPWALRPGLGSTLAGLAVLALAPGQRLLDLAGWVWPVLLAMLVASSFRGARRSLDNWSRRVLLYPALFVLLLLALGGALGTVAAATPLSPLLLQAVAPTASPAIVSI